MKTLKYLAFGLHQMVEQIQHALNPKSDSGLRDFRTWADDNSLQDDLSSLNHYIAEAYPILYSYPFRKKPAIDMHYLFEPDFIKLPQNIKEILDQPYNGCTYKSYTSLHIKEPTLVIKNDPTQILSTIKEMERIANLVIADYENETDKVWSSLGLSGDDSVDYGGTYVLAITNTLRAWAYLEYNRNPKFLKP